MTKPRDIHARTFRFAVAVVGLCRDLSAAAHPVTRRLGWQLLDASTSMGANLAEADGAQSKRDFVAKMAISRKEAQETVYWLRLIGSTDVQWQPKTIRLLDEATQLAAILSTIKKNAEKNPNRRKTTDAEVVVT